MVARVLETKAASRRRPGAAGRRGPGRRRGPADRVRGLQHAGRGPDPPGHLGHDDAQRHGHRAPQDAGRVVQRDALLGHRDRPGRGRGRDPDPVRDPDAGSAPDRGPGPAGGLAARPRGQRQPARRPLHGRRGPGRGRPPRRRLRPARVDRPDGRRAERGGRLGRDRGRGGLRPLPGPGPAGRDHRAVTDLAGQPHHPGGHAPHQQRGRRLELRDARAGPPQPRLRPRHGGRRSPAGPLRPGGRAPGHPRRRRALLPGRRRAHLRRRGHPDRCGRRHGWRVHRDQRQHHQRAARGGVVAPDADRPHVDPPQPALGGLPSLRAGDRHLGPGPRRGALLRPAGRVRCRGRPRRHRRAGNRARAPADPGPHRPGQPDHRPRPRRPDRAQPARAHRLRRRRRGRRGPGRRGPQLPPRCRRGDRCHRGGGPPPRLRQTPPDGPQLAPHRPPDRAPAGAAPDPGHAGRPRPGRGPAHAVPGPRGPRALRPGSGGHLGHQPAGRPGVHGAHLAAPGVAEGPGLQRQPPQRRRRPLRGGQGLPAAHRRPGAPTRARAPRRPPGRAGGPGGCCRLGSAR